MLLYVVDLFINPVSHWDLPLGRTNNIARHDTSDLNYCNTRPQTTNKRHVDKLSPIKGKEIQSVSSAAVHTMDGISIPIVVWAGLGSPMDKDSRLLTVVMDYLSGHADDRQIQTI